VLLPGFNSKSGGTEGGWYVLTRTDTVGLECFYPALCVHRLIIMWKLKAYIYTCPSLPRLKVGVALGRFR
jgi:hypothetical protein